MPQSESPSGGAIVHPDGATQSLGVQHPPNPDRIASAAPSLADRANERTRALAVVWQSPIEIIHRISNKVFNAVATSRAIVTNVAGDYHTWGPSDEQTVQPLLFALFAESAVAYIVYPPILLRFIANSDGNENLFYHAVILDFITTVISAIAMLHWGRFGDRYGRKPILLINMGGLAIAIVCFGMSTTFTELCLSKTIESFFKASLPTVMAAVAESSDRSHMAFVFSILPIIQGGGTLIGFFLVSTLENLAGTFPYLLLAFISVSICLCSLYFTAIFYKETLPLVGDHNQPLISTADDAGDAIPLLGHAHDREESQDYAGEVTHPKSFSRRESRAVLAVLGNYAIFLLLAVSFKAMFHVFLWFPTTSGGLSFTPFIIGNINSLSVGLHAITQACFFTRAQGRWGLRKIYRCAAVALIPTYAAIPIMGMIAKRAGYATPLVWAILVLQQIAYSLTAAGFICMFIFIATATPSPKALGRTNGLAQMVIIAMSIIGPTAFMSLKNLSGTLAQLIQVLLGFLAVGLSFSLP